MAAKRKAHKPGKNTRSQLRALNAMEARDRGIKPIPLPKSPVIPKKSTKKRGGRKKK